ncbi:hypothetical protein BVRB_4g072740 [Beta vulgaris subsp. vulgaris]|nr:hypothetical protein BVRB_4g072740 [Beta vulgaris subsp. vulgaris]
MHHLCSLSPQTPLPTTRNYFFFSHLQLPDNYTTYTFNEIIRRNQFKPTKRSNHHQWWISAMEKEPNNFEVDQDKARQALGELDQQFESLSTKQINPPKIRASSIGNLKEQVKNEPPEITGSFLGYTAFVLFVFSIFYNILFITVIRPSIDGPDEDIIMATDVTTTRSYQAPDVSQQQQ